MTAVPPKRKPRTVLVRPRAERNLSRLSRIGEEASRAARRAALLVTLDACKWNLTRTAATLEMTSSSDVIRAIKDLGLDAEYEAAKERGDVAKRRDNPSED